MQRKSPKSPPSSTRFVSTRFVSTVAVSTVLVLLLTLPVQAGLTITHESTPNLAIPDNSCTDALNGHGEGGVFDTLVFAETGAVNDIEVEVDIDHPWRGDLQFALSTASSTAVIAVGDERPLPWRGNASSTPLLANNTGGSADNFYATFDDAGATPCAAACSNASQCTSDATRMVCQPAEPLAVLLPMALPKTFSLLVCDRERSLVGILRRWSVTVAQPIPVELQSFSVD